MQHLLDNCITYREHFVFSATLGVLFLRAAAASFVHAVLPSACTTAATDAVRDISARLEAIGCKDD